MNTEEAKNRITTLWIFVMFNMLAADILGFMLPGALQQIIDNPLGITAEFMLIAAVMIEVPILMIFLSRILVYKLNRIANFISVVFTIFFIVGLGSPTLVYYFFMTIEVLAMLLIAWSAWKWKEE
ncbi:MAG: DUF6326 family protein [Candidatus Thorarchaeota archaeon]